MNFNDFLKEIEDLVCLRKIDHKDYSILFVDFNYGKHTLSSPNVFVTDKKELSNSLDINDDFINVYDSIITNYLNLGLESLNSLDDESKEKFSQKITETKPSQLYDRKFISRINYGSNSIAINGRIGPAQFIISNNSNSTTLNYYASLKPFGKVIYHNGILKDDEILLGRRNQIDQPGVDFVYYIENNTVHYDIENMGFFPHKQVLCMKI